MNNHFVCFSKTTHINMIACPVDFRIFSLFDIYGKKSLSIAELLPVDTLFGVKVELNSNE